MDTYKLKRMIIIITIFVVNIILLSIASVSIIQSVKRQLEAERNGIKLSQTEENSETNEGTGNDLEVPAQNSEDDMQIDFDQVVNYLKDGKLNTILSALKILIGVNLVIIAILILLKL